jgi:hypothetical protein
MRRIAMVVGVVLGGLVVPGPAGAGTGTAVSGWVVENQDPEGMFVAWAGSVTVTGVAGGAVTCPLTDGFGWADSGTLRPQDVFAEVGITSYHSGCTGSGPAGLEVYSTPGTVLHAESYDAVTDRISGAAYPWLWGMLLDAPDCQVDLYPIDSNAGAPLTFDNGTATIELGPIEVAVTSAEGAGCAGLAAVGDEMTVDLTVVATPGFTVHPLP